VRAGYSASPFHRAIGADVKLVSGIPFKLRTTYAIIGEPANRAAVDCVFIDYRSRRAANTLRRQDTDLTLFAEYLHLVGLHAEALALATHTKSWQRVTFGLVEGFQRWQLQQGYAIGSMNVRLSTIKVYAVLAFKANAISAAEPCLHSDGQELKPQRW
jgi:hypothetical protein